MTLLPSETRTTIRTAVALATGALEKSCTTTTASDAKTFTSADLIYASDDAIKGLECCMTSGSSQGEARLVSSFTASSDQVVAHKVYTALAAGGGETFDLYRVNIADTALLDDAIKYAIERAQDHHLIYWEDVSSLVTGSILKNGGFEDWASGTTVAPTGWTFVGPGGSVARSTTYLRGCRYVAAVTRVTTDAYLWQTNEDLILPYHLLDGKALTATAWVYSATTGCTLTLYSGADTTTDTHDGGGWDKLTATETVDSPTASSPVGIRVLNGTADKVIYIATPRLTVAGLDVYEYYTPPKFARVQKLIREYDDEFEFPISLEIPQRAWYADRDRQRIVMNGRHWPATGYRMKMIGQMHQQVPSADTDAIYLSMEYIVAMAKSYVMNARGLGSEADRMLAATQGERALRSLHNQPLPSSVKVR